MLNSIFLSFPNDILSSQFAKIESDLFSDWFRFHDIFRFFNLNFYFLIHYRFFHFFVINWRLTITWRRSHKIWYLTFRFGWILRQKGGACGLRANSEFLTFGLYLEKEKDAVFSLIPFSYWWTLSNFSKFDWEENIKKKSMILKSFLRRM